MGIKSIQRTIQASPERTWAAFTDFEHAAEHVKGIESVEILEPGEPGGAGMRFRETRRMGKRSHSEVLEITGFQPPTQLCIESDSCGGRFKTIMGFTPVPEGTRLDVELSFKPKSLLAKICTPLKGLFLGACLKVMQGDIDDLTAMLERE